MGDMIIRHVGVVALVMVFVDSLSDHVLRKRIAESKYTIHESKAAHEAMDLMEYIESRDVISRLIL
jgi:hypothetical protein